MALSAPAIARLIKSELGMPTVPDFSREGIRVQRGALTDTVHVHGQFELVGMGNRRVARIAAMLETKGYTVRLVDDAVAGMSLTVYGK